MPAGNAVTELPECLGGTDPACQLPLDLRFDPLVRVRETLFERNLRLPPEHVPQARIVGIAAADALRTRNVPLGYADARDRCDQLDKLIDGHGAVLSEVERITVIRRHQAGEALQAIIDVTERPRLSAISPHF